MTENNPNHLLHNITVRIVVGSSIISIRSFQCKRYDSAKQSYQDITEITDGNKQRLIFKTKHSFKNKTGGKKLALQNVFLNGSLSLDMKMWLVIFFY